MKLNLITTLSLVIFPILLLAQNYSISGKIHRHNLDPLPDFELLAIYDNDTSVLTTNTFGEFILENVPEGSTVTFAYYNTYDVYEDVTILDRIVGRDWLLQILLNSTPLQALAGDMNYSGHGNLYEALVEIDLVILVQLALRQETIYPVDSLWRLVPANFVIGMDTIPDTFTIEVSEDVNDFDFYAIKKGDLAIDSDYMPAPPEVANPIFTISHETFEVGDTVTYDISVQDFNNIAGFQHAIKWDTTMLKLIGVHSMHQVLTIPLGNNIPDQGWLPVYFDGYFSGGGTIDNHEVIFSLRFKALTESNTSSTYLEFTDTIMQSQVVWLDNQWNLFVAEGNYENAEAEDTTTTALHQFDLDTQLSIYPNPNQHGRLYVAYNSTNNFSDVSMVIYDVTGQVMLKEIRTRTKEKNIFSLDLSSLPDGIYTLKVTDERNENSRMFILDR